MNVRAMVEVVVMVIVMRGIVMVIVKNPRQE